MRLFLASVAVAAMLGTAMPAAACSVIQGYRTPTNFELIRKADLVVLARVKSGPSGESLRDADWDDAKVALEPIRAIKGVVPAEPLALRGYVSAGGRKFTAHPTPLNRAHPSSFAGACTRQEYAVGALLVAVFKKTDKGYVQESSPFARSAEDVEGENGTWVRAADAYARALELPAGERREALRREAMWLLTLRDDSAAPAIAADLSDAADEATD